MKRNSSVTIWGRNTYLKIAKVEKITLNAHIMTRKSKICFHSHDKKKRTKYVFASIIRVVLQCTKIRLTSLMLLHSQNTHQLNYTLIKSLFYPFWPWSAKIRIWETERVCPLFNNLLGKKKILPGKSQDEALQTS